MQSLIDRDVCPSDDTLGALVEHSLDPDEARQVASHLDNCPSCQSIAIAVARGTGPTLPGSPGVPGIHDLAAPASRQIRFGRYELRALLGVGGMGAVYHAYDSQLDRAVALKVLRPELSGVPGLADRLLHESRLMAKVAHPSVVTVHDVGREGDAVFVAMELVRGTTLTAWLASRALDWRAILGVFDRAGQGLAAAHSAGIVHRDFKPDNVLVSHDAHKVIVTDFGIAREAVAIARGAPVTARLAAARATVMTTDGAVVGTPAYMAPEQFAGGAIDRRADVFAFSVSLWEALFGARPFAGTSAVEIFAAAHRAPVRSSPRRVPARLVRALERGLALEPADRWPTMHALLAELAAIRSGRPWIALAAGAVGVVAGGVAVALAASRIEPPVDRCAAALAQLTDAYSPEIESSLSGVLARAPKVQTEQLAKLRGFVASWRKAHLATCRAEAPGAQDPTVALCLDARRLEIASSVRDVIAAGPEQAIHAPRITKVIVDPETCATPAPSLLFARVPADPELDRTVTALRYRLAEARDAFDREDFGRALELAQPVAEAAKVWPLLRVDAEVGVGACQRRLGDTKAAQATLRDALALAEGIHYDDFAVSVWIELAAMMTYDLHDAARGLEYIEHADTASAPGARPAKLTVELELVRGTALIALNRRRDGEFALHKAVELARAIDYHDVSGVAEELGYVHESEGRYTEAIAVFRNTAEQAPRAPSGVIIGHAAAFGALAVNLARLGKLSEAEATARQAVEIADRMYREARPMRTTVHLALAAVLEQVGDHAEALAEAAVAVTTMARLQGERSLVYAEAAQVEGDLLLDGRRYRGAELLLARSCEIRAFAQGDDGPELAGCETSHGAALIGLHRSAEALAELDRAVDSLTRSHQGPHPDLANALVVRGIAHAALGHHRQAGADFARAIAMLSSSELEPGALARAKWRLGALRWPADRAAARAEVTAALALFQTANPPWAAERSDAAAWLARHDRR